jgi:ppGpp synthetase/RelA/SpoT-type nucleotidyltranferase
MTFDEYCNGGQETYASFAEAVQRIIEAALQDRKKLQQIQKRAKAKESLKHRLPKDFPKDGAVERVRKDLAGVRLIFYTNSGAAEFKSQGILWHNFAIDADGIKIHGPAGDKRYTADHLVVALKDDLAALPEYSRFAGMKCEVQIHTILNHAWSEVEHDIIYKAELPKGFGQRDKEAIDGRMKRVMDDYLIKAGIELDLVIRDHTRLMEGKELFERGMVRSINEVENNNDLHHLLSNILERVLGSVDDPKVFSDDVIPAIILAVKGSRKIADVEVEFPGGSYPGKSALDVARKAAEIIDILRYADSIKTFDHYCDLYRGASSEERKIWTKNVEVLAKNELEVWQNAGPLVQKELVARIKELSSVDLFDLSGLILPALNKVLSDEVTGSSMTSHDAFTFTQGSVVASDALADLRSDAISVLTGMFTRAQDDDMRKAAFGPLSTAMHFPRYNQDEALRDIIRGNITNIVTFLTEQAPSLSFELRQHIEHSLYWAYWNSPRKPDVKS